jgi:hypothetical protein
MGIITAMEGEEARNHGIPMVVGEGGANSARIGWTRIISGARSRVGFGRRGSVRRGRIALLFMSRSDMGWTGLVGDGWMGRRMCLYSAAFGRGCIMYVCNNMGLIVTEA